MCRRLDRCGRERGRGAAGKKALQEAIRLSEVGAKRKRKPRKKAAAKKAAKKAPARKKTAAKKKAEAEGPSLEDMAPEDMLDHIEAIREILEFSDKEKEIRVMCEQSSIPKVLVDIAVSEPDRLDELEKEAEG